MRRRILIRIGVGIVTLWAVSAVVFLGTEALPGDAATAAVGRDATPERIAGLREEFGLNEPLLQRYGEWLWGLAHGDLGRSLPSGEAVSSLVSDNVRNTIVLTVATMLFLIPLSLLLGVLSAVKRDKALDQGLGAGTLALIATPEFVVGIFAVATFAVWLGLLPAVSFIDPGRSIFSQLSSLVLPVATLLAASLAMAIRMVRACMIDALQSEYVDIARLKGVPEYRVVFAHALPNALGPAIQVFALSIAWLLGGIVVVETVFQYPGLGLELASAVSRRDFGMVEALAMLITGAYILINLIADITVILLNPRLRRPAH